MAGWGHLYVTAHGRWKSGPWAGEIAQMGLRWTGWESVDVRGPVLTLRDWGAVTTSAEDRAITGYTVNQTFDLAMGGYDKNDMQVIQDDIVRDFATFMTSLNSYEAAPFSWTHFKVAPIERGTGKYLAPATTYTRTAPQEPSNSNALPPECAIAISFRAPVVGRRGRGRMYVPALNVTAVAADGTVATNIKSSWPTAARALVDDLANIPSIDTLNSGLIIGSGNSVQMIVPTEVRLGNHVDVQRRRQHQVDEIYTTLSV